MGYVCAGCLVLIELLGTDRFGNMPPVWKDGRCGRELRSGAWQRHCVRWQSCSVARETGTARRQGQASKKEHHNPSPRHVALTLSR